MQEHLWASVLPSTSAAYSSIQLTSSHVLICMCLMVFTQPGAPLVCPQCLTQALWSRNSDDHCTIQRTIRPHIPQSLHASVVPSPPAEIIIQEITTSTLISSLLFLPLLQAKCKSFAFCHNQKEQYHFSIPFSQLSDVHRHLLFISLHISWCERYHLMQPSLYVHHIFLCSFHHSSPQVSFLLS